MLYKAIIENIIDRFTAQVRIPALHKLNNYNGAMTANNLPIAAVCALPNSEIHFQVGDIVIVGFENNEEDKPIILGYLYTDIPITDRLSLIPESITVTNNSSLPAATTIGEIKSSEIYALKDVSDNIQKQLKHLQDQIDELREKVT